MARVRGSEWRYVWQYSYRRRGDSRMYQALRHWYEFDQRRYRLLACGCARMLPQLDDTQLLAIALTESWVDGRMKPSAAVKARAVVRENRDGHWRELNNLLRIARQKLLVRQDTVAGVVNDRTRVALGYGTRVHIHVFRDLLPRKVHRIEWPRRIRNIAEGIYAQRDFGYAAALTDAMMEEGVEHPQIERHLRNGQRHFRGCWAIDAILGRL